MKNPRSRRKGAESQRRQHQTLPAGVNLQSFSQLYRFFLSLETGKKGLGRYLLKIKDEPLRGEKGRGKPGKRTAHVCRHMHSVREMNSSDGEVFDRAGGESAGYPDLSSCPGLSTDALHRQTEFIDRRRKNASKTTQRSWTDFPFSRRPDFPYLEE